MAQCSTSVANVRFIFQKFLRGVGLDPPPPVLAGQFRPLPPTGAPLARVAHHERSAIARAWRTWRKLALVDRIAIVLSCTRIALRYQALTRAGRALRTFVSGRTIKHPLILKEFFQFGRQHLPLYDPANLGGRKARIGRLYDAR